MQQPVYGVIPNYFSYDTSDPDLHGPIVPQASPLVIVTPEQADTGIPTLSLATGQSSYTKRKVALGHYLQYYFDCTPAILSHQYLPAEGLDMTVNAPTILYLDIAGEVNAVFQANILPSFAAISNSSFEWRFGDERLFSEPPEILEEFLFPETRGDFESCEDIFISKDCQFDPRHGGGGTLSTYLVDGSRAFVRGTNSPDTVPHPWRDGISYLSFSGYIKGIGNTCSIASGVVTDSNVATAYPTDLGGQFVVLKFEYTIGRNDSKKLGALIAANSVTYTTPPTTGVPFKYFIESSGVRIYEGYGYYTSQGFYDPFASWTNNDYVGDTLVFLVGYKIYSVTDNKLVLNSASGVKDTAGPVWYNVSPGINSEQGTCSVAGNIATVTSVNPYYTSNVLTYNMITLVGASNYTKLIVGNGENTIILSGIGETVPSGTYTFALNTCDAYMVLLAGQAPRDGTFDVVSDMNPDEMIALGIDHFAFESGEIIQLLESEVLGPYLYRINVRRQSLFADVYPATRRYAGDIMEYIGHRGIRNPLVLLPRTHMAYDRSIRYNDVFSPGYPLF